jgi:phosphatidylglycerophosphate synthase
MPIAALAGIVALSGVGLGAAGWVVGVTCGVITNVALARGLSRYQCDRLGPADWVTLARATLAIGVAALVADSFHQPVPVTMLVSLTVIALALDAVDGWVARRTRTTGVLGERFDAEVDAFLILILSVYVARSAGAWVLAIGAARYLFAAAGWGLPWLREPLPPRYWRKVVTAVQGIALVVAAAGVLPGWATSATLAFALALLAESFGRDVWWLWRYRPERAVERADPARADPAGGADVRPLDTAARGRRRRGIAAAAVVNVLAVLLVWFALVGPHQIYRLTPTAFLRIPVEGLVLAGLALVLPSVARRAMAAVVGVLLGLLTLVKILDMGFFAAFDRPFNPVTDRSYLVSAVDLVSESAGPVGATVALVAVAVLVLAVLVGTPLSLGRLTRIVARHRSRSVRAVTGLLVVWVACAVAGAQLGPGEPIASTNAGRLAVGQVHAIAAGVRDQQRFEAAVSTDRFRAVSASNLLTGLRGKDVLLTFVESYGRTALQGSTSSSQVRAVLDAGTDRLRASGYSARSAFLTSPTFGGLSWLAHATLQSGVWVDNERDYDRLLSGDRMTLSRAFGHAGWRTLAVMAQNDRPWAQGKAFYRLDRVYDREDMNYAGPHFGFSAVPDQYILSVLQRKVLGRPDRAPVMAEIDLVSSHAPWAPIPRLMGWQRLGDGSVFDRIHSQGVSKEELWRNPEDIQAGYIDSIAYSLRSLISFVARYGDDDLVLIVLGDHQPVTVVSGHGASHDVPVTVVAHDPAVIDRISGWGWQPGMRPDPRAPVWPMDAFRNRFLSAYSPPLSEGPERLSSAPRP